ncbi:uncharacterized protein LOC142237449 [Haematobia irritans]|uniref:uncharacterized protein LOC142236391 n=1 Tax=Haematobia irritans TaxID=7368 RepID=UPI003F4FD1A6
MCTSKQSAYSSKKSVTSNQADMDFNSMSSSNFQVLATEDGSVSVDFTNGTIGEVDVSFTNGTQEIETPSPYAPPSPKKKKALNDVTHIMEEESKNFNLLGEKIEKLCGQNECLLKRLKNIDSSLDKLRYLKKEEIQENKRHHIEIEKKLAEKNEMKLELIKLKKLKLDIMETMAYGKQN